VRHAAPIVAALVALAAPPLRAADTQWWIANGAADHAKAESRGVAVRPEGVLSLGPAAREARADSLGVIWAIAVLADGSVALGGDRGRIDRWTEAGGVRPWARLADGQVLSLIADGDGVVAGTGPGGRVWRVSAKGDTTRLASTGERYVWGLAPAGRGEWWAATGTRGRLMRIAGGRARTVLDTDESNLVCLVPDGRGGVYAGGDSRGRVVHVAADGTARTVFDASEDEIKSLAVEPDGTLWAAALSASAVTQEEDPDGPRPTQAAVSGGRGVVYRIVPDSSAHAHWTSPQPFVFALLPWEGGIAAATGSRAGLYRVERAGGASQLLLLPQGQVTALASGSQGRLYAATSNPAALWRLGPGRAERGEILSQVWDARRIARFGALRWFGEARGGRVELHARSGNTDPPDTTWSAWHGGAGAEGTVRAAVPPARYLQWRLTLSGGDPRVESVEAAWREQNLPPRVEDVVVAPQGSAFREGELTPRTEPVTQTLPGGQKVEYSLPGTTNARVLRELPAWARGLRTVQWRGTDPNGDPLRYRVDARREPEGPWFLLGEDLEATAFTWDANAIPDGRYRLRVQASDANGNAVGEERVAETLSETFTIDNTPPRVTALDGRPEPGAIVVTGRAEDDASPLSRLEVAVDDGPWRAVAPEGGLTDDLVHTLRARLDGIEPGEHSVSLRAVDLAGNAVTRATRVTVPRAR
jgi:hypothetical protein